MVKNLLIIGAGSAGKMVADEIVMHTETSKKYKIIGFLDDDGNKKKVNEIDILGPISEAERIISNNKIHEVIIAIPSADRETINRILNILSKTHINTKIVPGMYEIIDGSVTLNNIREIQPEDLLGREEVGFDIDRIQPYYENKKIFITGAGGSIGSEILMQLLRLPVREAIAFGHGENSIHSVLNRVQNDTRLKYIIGDIRDLGKLSHEFNKYKPDIIFHAAAHKHLPLMEDYPDEAVKNNIMGTYNCAVAAIENSVEKFILISTDKAVNPSSVMGATKRVAEKIALALDKLQAVTRFSVTRFGNVLSSRGSVVHIFMEQIKNGGPLTITHPDITRYFMSIPEAARLVIKSGSLDEGKIFILDMGKAVKIVDLAKNMIRLSGLNDDDIKIKFTGLRQGEKINEELLTEYESISKTRYNKLFVSGENHVDINSEDELRKMIYAFRQEVNLFDKDKIKNLLKKYVPEYSP